MNLIPVKPQRRLLEKDIEAAVCRYAKARGLEAEKFTSPNRRAVPDRILLIQGGRVLFIEFKAPGKKPTDLQARDHARRRALGFEVHVVDSIEQGKRLIDEVASC